MDGAGKSTQIEALRRCLEQQGLRVRIIAFWDEIAALTRIREGAGHRIFKGEKGVGRPEAPVNRRDKNVRSFSMTCVRLWLYLLDALSTRMHFGRAIGPGTDFVIFDRYIYDQFANLDLRNPAIRGYVRMLMAFVPRPDVSFVLDADPVKARARKPEYPLEFLRVNRKAYLDLAVLVGGLTVIPPMSVAEVTSEILRHVAIGPGFESGPGVQDRLAESGTGAARADHAVPLERAG